MLDERDLSDLAAAVAEDPANHGARLVLAQVLLGAGQAAGALGHARILLTSTPRDPVVLGLAAMAADLSGDHHAALAFGATLRAALVVVSEATATAPGGSHSSIGATNRDADFAANRDATPPSISLLRLGDVAGLADDRRRLEDGVIRPWGEALRGRANPASGVLLYGPPSAGKRFFGHVAAGELGLGVYELDMTDVVDPWGEPGPSKILRAFDAAQVAGPAVVLLANLEVVTHRRLRYTANGRKVLTDLLAALDGRDRTKVLVVATSSAPWLVQPILRSAGRFSDAVLVGPPDLVARSHLVGRSLRRRSIAHDLDPDVVAGALQGCTTDDIDAVIDAAIARAYADSTALGRVSRVQSAHFDYALRTVRTGANMWFDTAYNFPEFTDDSSQFDPLFDYIRRHVRRS